MPIRRPLDWQGPRNLTGGDGYTVDLGMVNLRDAAIYGPAGPLIPFANGRLIKSVRFVPGGTWNTVGYDLSFITPNLLPTNPVGFANINSDNPGGNYDTLGVITSERHTSITGEVDDKSQILDCGPLFAQWPANDILPPIGTWQPNTAYCIYVDYVIDANDHVQQVITNGVSGVELPDFSTSGGTTNDGSVVWSDHGLIPSGEIHVVAEVMEGITPMPPYPASLEFVDGPATAVAGFDMDPITILIKDQYGNPYTFIPHYLELSIYGVGGPASGIGGVLTDASTGIATFIEIQMPDPGTYVMRSHIFSSAVSPIFSQPFEITSP